VEESVPDPAGPELSLTWDWTKTDEAEAAFRSCLLSLGEHICLKPNPSIAYLRKRLFILPQVSSFTGVCSGGTSCVTPASDGVDASKS